MHLLCMFQEIMKQGILKEKTLKAGQEGSSQKGSGLTPCRHPGMTEERFLLPEPGCDNRKLNRNL